MNERSITVEELTSLLDYASPKAFMPKCMFCAAGHCHSTKNHNLVGNYNALALDDETTCQVLGAAETEIGCDAIPLATHLLKTSKQWGMPRLGPLTLAKIQEILLL